MRAKAGICLAISLCSSAAYAGGVGLGATRMVYSSTTNQSMLQVRNTHPDATFLIQSWMENEEGQAQAFAKHFFFSKTKKLLRKFVKERDEPAAIKF